MLHIVNDSKCLNEKQMALHGSDFELVVQIFIIPPLAILGIVGNCLNLCVLLKMRTRSNTFLTLLAFADILFLLLLFPHIIAAYYTQNNIFRFIYFPLKYHLISLGNWCSAVAMCERLIGIRQPLYARAKWASWKMPVLIGGIIFVPGILHSYQHVEHECALYSFCNNTQIKVRCAKVTNATTIRMWNNNVDPYTDSFRSFVSLSAHVFIYSNLVFPILLLSVLNVMLICALRKRSKGTMSMMEHVKGLPCSRPEHVEVEQRASLLSNGSVKTSAKNETRACQRASSVTTILKTEQRATLTAALIISTFTLTNGPSALVEIYSRVFQIDFRRYYNIVMLSNVLVIFGKASNFILFCMSSKHFREKLVATLTQNGKRWTRRLESSPGSRGRLLTQEDATPRSYRTSIPRVVL